MVKVAENVCVNANDPTGTTFQVDATGEVESLRLVANDEADLEVVSALLQDAIIAGADLHYDAQHECFMIATLTSCPHLPLFLLAYYCVCRSRHLKRTTQSRLT